MPAIDKARLHHEGDMSEDDTSHEIAPALRGLFAGQSAQEAFIAIVTECCDRIDRHLLVFLDGEDHSGPHKTRVALRRLTTALDAFAPILRQKEARHLRAEAKLIFRALGDVRDSDVLLATRPEGSAPRRLVAANTRLRAKVRAALRKRKAVAFAPAVIRRMAEGRLFRAKSPGLKARSADVTLVATRALADSWGNCLAIGPDLAALSDKRRHTLRKRLKTYRYLAEFFAPIWQGADPNATDWPDTRRTLQLLQDRLGDLNDLALARQRLGWGPEDEVLVSDAMAAADALWRDMISRPAFWHPTDD